MHIAKKIEALETHIQSLKERVTRNQRELHDLLKQENADKLELLKLLKAAFRPQRLKE